MGEIYSKNCTCADIQEERNSEYLPPKNQPTAAEVKYQDTTDKKEPLYLDLLNSKSTQKDYQTARSNLKLTVLASSTLQKFQSIIISQKGLSQKQEGYTYFGTKRKLTKKGQPINDVVFPALDEEFAERHRGNHFYIRYCYKSQCYKIKDLGIGFGVFMRHDDELVLRNNTLINIGLQHFTVNTAYGTELSFQQNPDFQNLENNGLYYFGNLGFSKMNKEEFINTVYSAGKRELAFLKLQFFGGKANEEIYYFCTSLQGIISIGRAKENLINYDDSLLSKKQCEIIFQPQKGWTIQDQNSTNGIWVYVNEECKLYEESIFKANQTMFKVNLIE